MSNDLIAKANALLAGGFEHEARSLLVEIVDADSGNGEVWFLLSRLAENTIQRGRFLANAQRTGYLATDTDRSRNTSIALPSRRAIPAGATNAPIER